MGMALVFDWSKVPQTRVAHTSSCEVTKARVIPWLGLSSLDHLFSSRTSRWNRQGAAAALSLQGLIKT